MTFSTVFALIELQFWSGGQGSFWDEVVVVAAGLLGVTAADVWTLVTRFTRGRSDILADHLRSASVQLQSGAKHIEELRSEIHELEGRLSGYWDERIEKYRVQVGAFIDKFLDPAFRRFANVVSQLDSDTGEFGEERARNWETVANAVGLPPKLPPENQALLIDWHKENRAALKGNDDYLFRFANHVFLAASPTEAKSSTERSLVWEQQGRRAILRFQRTLFVVGSIL